MGESENPAVAIMIPELQSQELMLDREPGLWVSVLTVHEGQAIEKDQLIARLETREGWVDLTSPRSGFVVGLHIIPGQVAQPGQVLCYIASKPSISTAAPATPVLSQPAFDPSALLIFGGGGHGKILIDLIRAMGTYRIIGIIDDGLPIGSEILGVPILGGTPSLGEWYTRGVHLAVNGVAGIGNVDARLKIFDILTRAGFAFPVLVHPSAVIERSAFLAAGVQILARAYIGGSVKVGFGSVLNVGCIVSHDSVLGKVVNLSPGATLAGNVRVEDYSQIGMLASVNLNITIGERSQLGNGCTVKANVPPRTRVRAGTIWPPPKGDKGD